MGSKEFFDHLDSIGYRKNGQIRRDLVQAAKLSDLMALCEFGVEQLSGPDLGRVSAGIFSHVGSLSIGGGPDPCNALDCRLKRAQHLVAFLALYSDGVHVANFLGRHVAHPDEQENTKEARESICDDLAVICRLEKPIEFGLVSMFSPSHAFCANCIAARYFGRTAKTSLSDQADRLLDTIGGDLEISITRDRTGLLMACYGSDSYLDHGQTFIPIDARALPEEIAMSAWNWKPVRLDRQAIATSGVPERIARKLVASLTFQMMTAMSSHMSLLTDLKIHVDMLSGMSGNEDFRTRNDAVYKNLASLIPEIDRFSIPEIMKLRQREPEAFIAYRRALTEAVDACLRAGHSLTEKDAVRIHADIVIPALADLTSAVKAAKRSFRRSTLATAVAWGAAISFGMYEGYVPSGFAAAAAAVGLTKVIADFASTLGVQVDSEKDVRRQGFWFLWKVQQTPPRLNRGGR